MDNWARDIQWNAIAYAVVGAGCVVGLIALFVSDPGLRRRWLPMPRLRPGDWGGYEVFLAFCLYIGFPLLIVDLLRWMGFFTPLIGPAPADEAPVLERTVYAVRCGYISSPLALTLILGFLMAFLFARTETRPQHFGLTWGRWQSNLALGLVAFLIGRPVVLGVFALIVLVAPPEPGPLEQLVKLDLPAWEWALLAFQTTVMAALLEEITFRGVLQGWLRRASLSGHLAILMLALFLVFQDTGYLLIYYDTGAEAVVYEWEKLIELAIALAGVGGYGYALARLRQRFGLDAEETRFWQPLPEGPSLAETVGIEEEIARERRLAARERDEQRIRDWADANANLAIFGSALLFAVVHPWPGSLALFPMGLMLGWMQRRTQSLLGPIVFHSLFNLTTFIALYATVLEGRR